MYHKKIAQGIIDLEKETIDAFKQKNIEKFTKGFDDNYISVAGDGIKKASGEIEGLKRLDFDIKWRMKI